MMPDAGSEWPSVALDARNVRGVLLRRPSSSRPAAAPTSMGSPREVPVACSCRPVTCSIAMPADRECPDIRWSGWTGLTDEAAGFIHSQRTLTCNFKSSPDDNLLTGAVGGGQRAGPAALVDSGPCQQDGSPLWYPRTNNHDRARLQGRFKGRPEHSVDIQTHITLPSQIPHL